MFRTLLVIDTLRGPHSTGVASIDRNGDWKLAKKKGNAWDLFDSKSYTNATAGTSYALIGHNRYATKGKINNINAHPFEFEDVVGCHNGTIRGQHRLVDHLDFEVDSENIFHSIQQVGLEDTLDVLDGAYALTYWDKRTEELILLRNSERTLYYAFSEDRQTIFWASEAWMISVACSRHGMKITDIVDVKPCVIHRFDIDMVLNPKPVDVSFQTFKEFIAPRPPVTFPQSRYYGGGQGSTYSSKKQESAIGQGKGTKRGELNSRLAKAMIGSVVEFTVEDQKQTANGQWYVLGRLNDFPEAKVRVFAPLKSPTWDMLLLDYDSLFEGKVNKFVTINDEFTFDLQLNTVQEVIEFDDDGEDTSPVLGYGNRLLTNEQFKGLTKQGCAWCAGSVTLLDAKNIHWVSHDTFVCSSCQEKDGVKEHIGG